MKTITIIEGVTLTATQSTIDRVLEERRIAEAEAYVLRWLADPENRNDPFYSDIYKDVHGFRPRW